MQTYRIETTIIKDGMISIEGLPFLEGDKVEVVVRSQHSEQVEDEEREKYPLRDLPFVYIDPFIGVAEEDWEILE